MKVKHLMVLVFYTFMLSLSSISYATNENSFFTPTAYSDDELERLSLDFEFNNLVDEYTFSTFEIVAKIDEITGFCVTDSHIYVSDYSLERIHVFDHSFKRVYSIRHGLPGASHFYPRGLYSPSNDTVYVITDINGPTGDGYIIEYDRDFEYNKHITFNIRRHSDYTTTDQLAVLPDSAYFTLRSDDKEEGKIYNLRLDGTITQIGNESFGYLCEAIDAQNQVTFINGFYSLNEDGVQRIGLPALYGIQNDKVVLYQKLPAYATIPLTEEEKNIVRDYAQTSTIAESDMAHLLQMQYGFSGITVVGDAYFALVERKPAILVFDETFQYQRTIPININNEWNLPELAKDLANGKMISATVQFIDADSSGNLFMLARLYDIGAESAQWIGVVGKKR